MTTPGTIRANYWASARAAAGCGGDEVPVEGPISLTEVKTRLVALHPESRLAAVLESCSVLVGDQPVASRNADQVMIEPGSALEFLPPFAGG